MIRATAEQGQVPRVTTRAAIRASHSTREQSGRGAPASSTNSGSRPSAHAGGPQEAEDGAREPGHGLDERSIRRDDDQRPSAGQIATSMRAANQVGEVAGREEERRQVGPEDDQPDDGDDEDALTASQDAPRIAGRATAATLTGRAVRRSPAGAAEDDRVRAYREQYDQAIDRLEPELDRPTGCRAFAMSRRNSGADRRPGEWFRIRRRC